MGRFREDRQIDKVLQIKTLIPKKRTDLAVTFNNSDAYDSFKSFFDGLSGNSAEVK